MAGAVAGIYRPANDRRANLDNQDEQDTHVASTVVV